MLGGSYLIARQNPNSEKLSPFECGFAPFDDARGQFDVRFYLVAILFIIFDLEVAFLFPWAVTLGDIGLFGFWSMMLFLGVLTVGLHLRMAQGSPGMGVITPAKPDSSRRGGAVAGPERRTGRQGLRRRPARQADHLGAHRLDVGPDLRSGLLRRRDDPLPG